MTLEDIEFTEVCARHHSGRAKDRKLAYLQEQGNDQKIKKTITVKIKISIFRRSNVQTLVCGYLEL